MKTIKDIAALANVSIGTVDRVIHNRSGVSKKTKERIEKIIKEHNFQINKTARTLALNKKYDIAVLMPGIESSSDFWYLPKMGIEKASEEFEMHRISISYFHFKPLDFNSFKTAFDKLLDNSFDAVLLTPIFLNEAKERLIQLDKRKTPYVFFNVELQETNYISYIGQHSFDSGTLAAKLMSLLIDNENEILIIKVRKNRNHHSAIDDRISGFKSYFKSYTPPIKIHEVILPNIKNQEAINTLIFKELTNHKIKGLFVPSSKVTIVANYLETYKLEGLKLIGFDLSEENIDFVKNETIDFLIDQSPFYQGYESTKILFNFIINDVIPEKNRYLPIKLLTKENVKYL
ncbi:LacI family DNA-binding transcriptional regulator [Flavivirga amylovorans]|uniref:LacI family DNA-binding transcriptional regulator n=1 Tax=Flavivirga amylovorans TaxID=870486 RepID=A0ABT8WYH4_9FLAO|nr:LacI family DNA-binding transcriptional regulator [Flavivirga amylovorans]MDO5986721.1 LacI family DNA-binding transcriptional regulator [Flavivirga amylovorans]